MTETVTVLNLSGNKLGSKGVLAVAGALQVIFNNIFINLKVTIAYLQVAYKNKQITIIL